MLGLIDLIDLGLAGLNPVLLPGRILHVLIILTHIKTILCILTFAQSFNRIFSIVNPIYSVILFQLLLLFENQSSSIELLL